MNPWWADMRMKMYPKCTLLGWLRMSDVGRSCLTSLGRSVKSRGFQPNDQPAGCCYERPVPQLRLKLGSNLGPTAAKYRLRPCTVTQRNARRINEIYFCLLPWAQGAEASNPLAPTNSSLSPSEKTMSKQEQGEPRAPGFLLCGRQKDSKHTAASTGLRAASHSQDPVMLVHGFLHQSKSEARAPGSFSRKERLGNFW